MAENFSAYTEVDPNTRIAVISTKVTWTLLQRDEDAYVYKDKTANFFDGSFVHYLTIRVTGGTNGGLIRHWALANLVDDWQGIDDANGDGLSVFAKRSQLGPTYIVGLEELDGGTVYSTAYTITVDTVYYLKIVRDESVGTYGTIYLYIYSDAARNNLLDELSITLHTSKKDYQYIYACQSNDTSLSYALSGYTENLALFKVPTPIVTTGSINEILSTTATAWGDITSLGNATVTEHGHCWSTNANPTTSDSKTTKGAGSLGLFYSLVTSLSADTTYYIRAYATNSFGTAYGSDVTFVTTSTGAPAVTTEVCTDITATTATGNGFITSIGNSAVTEHGHCWDTSLSPTTTDSSSGKWGKTTNGAGYYGAFTSAITGLIVGTTYYIRAYATNTQGTSYGGNITLVAGGVSSEASGVISVVRERLHYVSASGIEYYIWGEPV